MSTTTSPTPAAASVPSGPAGGQAQHTGRLAAWLLVGLLVSGAYAAFWHGATDLPAETRLQVVLAGIGLATAVAWLGTPGRAPQLHSRALLGLGLIFAFTVWVGLSLLWTVAPANSWVELNRWIAYLLVLLVAAVAATRARRPLELASTGWLAISVGVAAWALAGKIAPWITVGPIDLNHTAIFARLRAPLGYWNALGLICALAAPLALRQATDATAGPRTRVRALGALAVLLLTLGLTYSRGGVLALVAGIATTIWLSGPRLRGLAAFGMAATAALPALVVDFASHAMTADNQSLGGRTAPGLLFGAALALSLLVLARLARRLIAREQLGGWTQARATLLSRQLGRAGLAATALLVVVLAATGTISSQVDSFTATRALSVSDPARLLSSNSGNRWVWWKEAAGAFSDRPVAGYGAGSFPVTHLLYRKPPALPVNQPHSVPLQLLAETGLVGTILCLGGLLALLAAAAARIRAAPPGRARDLAGACTAAAAAWLVHGLVDWDIDIPGVTVPALLLLGVAVAAPLPGLPRPVRPPRPWPPRGGSVLVGLATVTLAAVAASAIMPAWSQSKAQHALSLAAAARRPTDLERAQSEAELAARLNPLAVQPLLYAAAIAQRRHLAGQARSDLLRAADRQPDYAPTWYRLVLLTIAINDRTGAVQAAARLLSLDPVDQLSREYGAFAKLVAALPEDSPTATGTPLAAPAGGSGQVGQVF